MSQPVNPLLLKTCSVCGLQKPLSAFLHMSGTEGTTYGTICSTCRKTAPEHSRVKKTEAEGSTTSDAGHSVDSKSKVHSEIDKRDLKKNVDDLYHEDRKDEQILGTDKLEKSQQIAKEEKAHRKSFLDKRSFLSTDKAAVKQHAETIARQEQSKEKATKDEEALRTIDLTAPFIPSQTGAQVKYQGVAFKAFKSWLGSSAPIVKQAGTQKPNEKETLSEAIDNNFGPGTKRR
jgi:hypothetical protein